MVYYLHIRLVACPCYQFFTFLVIVYLLHGDKFVNSILCIQGNGLQSSHTSSGYDFFLIRINHVRNKRNRAKCLI